jgi:23S rRNA (pseudouridine1915-N3)-methyltransferase
LRLLLIAVGRIRPGPLKDLQRLYTERLGSAVEIREVEERRPLPPHERKEREGALLLAALPEAATVVALDAAGRTFSSEDFAAQLGRWRDSGVARLAFLIGGADGLSDGVRRRAELLLSLGLMTWPHLLVRGMLLEQLYRAQQIQAGHPYHLG